MPPVPKAQCLCSAGDGRLRLRATVPEGSGLYAGTVRSQPSDDSASDLSGDRCLSPVPVSDAERD